MRLPFALPELDRQTILLVGLLFLLAVFFSFYLAILIFMVIGFFSIRLYQHPSNSSKYQTYLTNTVIAFSSVCLLVLIIEVYFHLARPAILKLDVNIVGDFSDFTSRGYLHKDVFRKKAGSFRILSLGDSFARNLTWENKNYHDYLEKRLLHNGFQNIDIVNAGMEGTGPGYYWHILKKYGDAISPDLVMVGFFVGNDFEELEFKYTFRGIYGIKERVDPLARFLSFFRFQNWWTYQFAARRLILLAESYKNRSPRVQARAERASFSEGTFLAIERNRMWIFEKPRQPVLRKSFTQGAEVIRQLKDWCAARNVGLLVAIFPDQFQVEEQLRARLLAYYHLDSSTIDIYYPNQLLSEYCKTHNISYVDMLPAFQQAARSRELYRLQDTHWNEAGNRLAAELIFAGLQKNQLARKSAPGSLGSPGRE